MAEYDLTPFELDDDFQGVYELMKRYFIRENNPFNVTSEFINEDGFTFDVLRSYSFVASTYKATAHIIGKPLEDGRTKVSIHAKSVDSAENLEKEIRDRIKGTLTHMVAQKKNTPVETGESATKPGSERRQLIIVLVVALIIVIGIMPWSCSDQFSQFWMV